jgi:hypothetical protein
MSKNILRKKFNNMYGKDKPLNSSSTMNNIMNSITPNNINYNTNSFERNIRDNHLIIESSSSNSSSFLFVFFIIFIFGFIIYFFKDVIYQKLVDLWNSLFNKNSILSDKINNVIKTNNDAKNEEEIKRKKEEDELKKEKSQIEQEKENERKKELEKNSGINQLNMKVNDLSNYKKEQIATSNGFCYIGYDLGQRECTDIYSGEVCMSGQIFPTLDKCLKS